MSQFDFFEQNYTISNFKQKGYQKLLLSKALDENVAEKWNISGYESEVPVTRQWFWSTDIGEWQEVEVTVEGNSEKPYEEFVEMADCILKQLHIYLKRSFEYLKQFISTQKSSVYYLSSVSFGRLLNFDEHILTGFSLVFVYGDYPNVFQYKVKFNRSGWPIGFEGGPL
ncbi:hypothetical protein [Priestia megaterium]|uniref:hypothetical protein n=1 Tax=Priestia megaterium TaxID=1404 RepID=UPI001D1C6E4C|nr:hypothetical protein [Priestia megaterium]CAH0324494.1 hypothetical protein SRABI82_05875 [Priestia megaterium]